MNFRSFLDKFKKRTDAPDAQSAFLLKPDSPFATIEAYRMMRTNIMYVASNMTPPIYGVTSAMPNDGKSINCANVAISFALAGKKVLLIDADMRNPTQADLFGLSSESGLSEYLAAVSKEPTILPTEYENLSVIVAGHRPPNPAELLGTTRIDELFKTVQDSFDYIFIDLPPVNIISDATILASKLTGFLFVVDSGHTHAPSLKRAIDTIQMVEGKIIGFALNRVNPKKGGSSYYGYDYKSYRYTKRYYKNYDTVPTNKDKKDS